MVLYNPMCIAKIKIGWSDAYFLQISLINIEEKNNDRSVDEDHTNQIQEIERPPI